MDSIFFINGNLLCNSLSYLPVNLGETLQIVTWILAIISLVIIGLTMPITQIIISAYNYYKQRK